MRERQKEMDRKMSEIEWLSKDDPVFIKRKIEILWETLGRPLAKTVLLQAQLQGDICGNNDSVLIIQTLRALEKAYELIKESHETSLF